MVVALIQVPLGVIGASKIGGAENSFHAIYYFTAAAWFELAASRGLAARWIRRRIVVSAVVAALAGLFGVVSLTGWRMTPAAHLEVSCSLATAHRGEILFPRNPLVTWWTE